MAEREPYEASDSLNRLEEEEKKAEKRSRPIVVTRKTAKVVAIAAVLDLDEKVLEVTVENKGDTQGTCSVTIYLEDAVRPKVLNQQIPAHRKAKLKLTLDDDALKAIKKLQKKGIRGLQLSVEVHVVGSDTHAVTRLLNVEVPTPPSEEESEEDGV